MRNRRGTLGESPMGLYHPSLGESRLGHTDIGRPHSPASSGWGSDVPLPHRLADAHTSPQPHRGAPLTGESDDKSSVVSESERAEGAHSQRIGDVP